MFFNFLILFLSFISLTRVVALAKEQFQVFLLNFLVIKYHVDNSLEISSFISLFTSIFASIILAIPHSQRAKNQ